jgi:hypothetical protein
MSCPKVEFQSTRETIEDANSRCTFVIKRTNTILPFKELKFKVTEAPLAIYLKTPKMFPLSREREVDLVDAGGM